MKPDELERWWSMARRVPSPVPPEDFPGRVLGAVERLRPLARAGVLDQLGLLFPRVALAAAIVFVAAAGLDAAVNREDPADWAAQAVLENSETLAWLEP